MSNYHEYARGYASTLSHCTRATTHSITKPLAHLPTRPSTHSLVYPGDLIDVVNDTVLAPVHSIADPLLYNVDVAGVVRPFLTYIYPLSLLP